jgi:diadenosine tetraphosphate (Ap4A) HIT family hydrolase
MSEWPADWSERLRGRDCPLCALAGLAVTDHGILLWRAETSDVWLARHSAVVGYCVVVWRDGHVAEPTALESGASAAYWHDVTEAGRAIEGAFSPMKVNYMLLGNQVPHLHAHVFPRYVDDPAPGGPLSWDALTSVPPTPEAALEEHAAQLRVAAGRTWRS